MLPDAHVKLNQGLQWQKQNSKRRVFFFSNLFLDLREKLLSPTAGAQLYMLLKHGHCGM